MCDTQNILHQNKIGYISTCKECNHFHIEIGSFMIILKQKSFERLLSDLQKKKEGKQYYNTFSGSKLLIRLTDNSFISLTKEEFEFTLELFELSNHLVKAKLLIKK
jgi:hypothetical protein